MTSTQSDNDNLPLLLKNLCEAGARGEAAQIGTLLRCRRTSHSPALDEPLLLLGRDTVSVDQLLAQHFNDDPLQVSQLPQHTGFEHIIKALLLVPSIYETPWKTAHQCIQLVHTQTNHCTSGIGGAVSSRNSTNLLRSMVADIQSFLQQAVTAWWEEERKQMASSTPNRRRAVKPLSGDDETVSGQTPRNWIVQLVSVVMEPLLLLQSTKETPKSEEYCWTVPLDLVATIVSLSNDLETTLLNSVLDEVFQKKVRFDRILFWVNAASELRLFLREDDWKRVQASLKESLEMQPCQLPNKNLPVLAETLMSLCATTTSSAEKEASYGCWQELLLLVLSVAASTEDVTTYAAVETILESSMASLPSCVLQQWTSTITFVGATTTTVGSFKQRWIEANVLLLVLRASRQSGSQMVARLVAQAFGAGTKKEVGGGGSNAKKQQQKSRGGDLNEECWKRLIGLSCRGETATGQMGKRLGTSVRWGRAPKNNSSRLTRELQQMFKGQTYSVGHGRFTSPTTDKEGHGKIICSTSLLVFHSLFLGQGRSLEPTNLLPVMERAQAWLLCANDVLASWTESTAMDLVLAIVILVTVYCELPLARPPIVRTMLHTFEPDGERSVDLAGIAALYSLFITSVLSSSSSEDMPASELAGGLELMSGIFDRLVSFDAFRHLAWALAPVPSANKALLAAAQNRLGILRNSFQTCRWSADEASSHGRRGRDSTESIKCGVLALVVIICSDIWDEYEVEAWCLLADIIVENRPSLPLPARSWLFLQLKDSIAKDFLSVEACPRVLRACLSRLLFYIGPDNDGLESFLYEKALKSWGNGRTQQMEDIAGIFALTFALVDLCYSGEGACQGRKKVLARCRKLLPKLIELGESNSDLLATGDEACMAAPPLLETDANFSCYVAFYCITLSFRKVSTARLNIGGKMLPSSDEMLLLLREQERQGLSGKLEPSMVTIWLAPPKNFVSTSAYRGGEKEEGATIRLALCDIVVKLILGPPTAEARSSSDSHTLALQLSDVMDRKRMFAKRLQQSKAASASVLPDSPRVLVEDFEVFCSIVVPVVKQHVAENLEVSEVDQMLSAIVDFCDMVARPSEDDECFTMPRLLCLRDLYESLCQEKAAVDLIAYLEARLMGGDEKKLVCQIRIGGPEGEGIDAIVRRVRLSIASTVSTSLVGFARIQHGLSENTSSMCSECLGFVRNITRDLRAGLDGASGGLTYDIFLSFLDCIDHGINVLFEWLPCSVSVGNDQLSSLSVENTCMEASKLLEEIICTYALKQATAFRKTLILCAGTLPALARHIWRKDLISCGVDPSAALARPHGSAAIKLFFQVVSILIRKSELDDTIGTPWEMIVGKDHLGDLDEEDDRSFSSDCSGSTDTSRKLPPSVGMANLPKDKIVLRNEQAWTWSMCCILQAFESNWEESHRLLQRAEVEFRAAQAFSVYYASRSAELASTIKSTCELFRISTMCPKERNTVFAVMLPTGAKTKLCAFADRVLIVLQKALKLIDSELQGQTQSISETRANLSIIEAVSCVSAWIGSQLMGVELASGLQRWYLAEKKMLALPRGEHDVYKAESSALLRLPKLIIRLEEVGSLLRKLSQTLCVPLHQTSKGAFLLKTIDTLVDQRDADSVGSFSAMLKSKLQFLEQEQLQLEIDFGFTTATAKKRNNSADIGKRLQKARRRKIIRSRNGVVDSWLQIDRNAGTDEALHEDAYADLEDFLVDG